MKQKERAPFHRCLIDRSLHYFPTTKASKPYFQQTLEFHIRDDGTPDGASKFGRLCCAPGLHFAQQSISHGCRTSGLPPSGGPCQGCGCWQLQPHRSSLPWRCARVMAPTCPHLGTGQLQCFVTPSHQQSPLAETLGCAVLA